MTPVPNSADCLCKIHTVDTKRYPDGANKIMLTLKLQKSQTNYSSVKCDIIVLKMMLVGRVLAFQKVLGMIYPPKTRQ